MFCTFFLLNIHVVHLHTIGNFVLRCMAVAMRSRVMKSQCLYFGRGCKWTPCFCLWLVSGRTINRMFTNLENMLAEIAKTSSNIILTPKRNCLYIKKEKLVSNQQISFWAHESSQSTEINSMTSKPTQPHFLAFKQVQLITVLPFAKVNSRGSLLRLGFVSYTAGSNFNWTSTKKTTRQQIWQPRDWHPRSCRKFL